MLSVLGPRNPDSQTIGACNDFVEGILAIIYLNLPILQIRKLRLRDLTRVLGQVSGRDGLESKSPIPQLGFFWRTSISLHTILSWLLTYLLTFS